MILDIDSDPGSWRAALNPAASCAVCRQSQCEHSDLEFGGLVPALHGDRQPSADGMPPISSFHATGNSRG